MLSRCQVYWQITNSHLNKTELNMALSVLMIRRRLAENAAELAYKDGLNGSENQVPYT